MPPQFSRATRRHSPRAALPHLAAFPRAQTQPQAPNPDGSIVVIGEAMNAPPFSLVPCRLDLVAPALTHLAGFPTLVAPVSVCQYYEITIGEAIGDAAQYGWIDAAFTAGVGGGVGDDEHSWGVDGARLQKWHGNVRTCSKRGAPATYVRVVSVCIRIVLSY